QQKLHDGGWICQSCGLDENTAKWRHLATVAPHQKCAQRLLKVAADGAANAAARKHGHLAIDAFDQEMVEADFPVFVDDDRAVLHAVVPQHAIEQRRFAAAEKPGYQRYWQALGGLVAFEEAH